MKAHLRWIMPLIVLALLICALLLLIPGIQPLLAQGMESRATPTPWPTSLPPEPQNQDQNMRGAANMP